MNVRKPDVKYMGIQALAKTVEIFLNFLMPSGSTSFCRSFNHLYQTHTYTLYITMTRSIQLKSPAIAIVRQNSLSFASCRASVAVTPSRSGESRWWVADHRHVSIPAMATRHLSPWYRF